MRLAIAVTAVALAAPAAVSAAPGLGGLHDRRYCEVIELRGTPPDAQATVWNTVGLNSCPPSQWPFDAAALAEERGDTAVVLNGPRHWLIDAVTGSAGRTHAFRGLRMRRVARIPIRTTAELTRTPYSDRIVERDTVWHWRARRRVFELVAPGGDVYVMQSYAKTVDPRLRLPALAALGRRLALPDGWRYRVRTLRRPFALRADGRATILQDELQNTYQLRTVAREGVRRTRALKLTGAMRTVGSPDGPGSVHDRGTVTGTPFGDGTIDLAGRIAGGRLTGTFRLVFPRGSVAGTVDAPFTVDGERIEFRGTGRVTGGTGAFRGIRSGALELLDRNTLDGQNGSLTVTGSVSYRGGER